MEQLPTWTVAIALVPLLLTAFARRHDRHLRPLEALAFAGTLAVVVLAVGAFPEAIFGAVRIGLPLAALFAAVLVGGAMLEAIPSKLRSLSSGRGHAPAPRPQPARSRRVATGTWSSTPTS